MEIGERMRMARLGKKLAQQAVADAIGVTQQAVSDWEKGGGIDEEHWQSIKELLGVDVAQHISMRDATRSPSINAQNVGSLHFSADDNFSSREHSGGHYELLNDIEYEVLTLFRKYGNPTLLQRCLGQLRQAQELFG